MITYTTGNLLESEAVALVNTVNTVGVMGKGIALMFKDRFKLNYDLYRSACEDGEVKTGELFITKTNALVGPVWIINFPTKEHWRSKSKLIWISSGLEKLREFIVENKIESIAIPPLGSGNGGLDWRDVKPEIEKRLDNLENCQVIVFEPTSKYQNVSKRNGVEKLTPARAIIAELVRSYWVLGMECSLLEIQKLAWFAERFIEKSGGKNPLNLAFKADKFGPYATKLGHLLNALDGSYLHCEKRISDASPIDVIWFDEAKHQTLELYIDGAEFSPYKDALEKTVQLIDGFESPFGMELLATVDWLITNDGRKPATSSIQHGLAEWPRGATRKKKIFNERAIQIALSRLVGSVDLYTSSPT